MSEFKKACPETIGEDFLNIRHFKLQKVIKQDPKGQNKMFVIKKCTC